MKRSLSTIVFLVLLAYTLSGQSIIRTPMGEILNDLSYFNSLYPRLEGSKGENAAFLYIKSVLDDNKIDYSENKLTQLRHDHSFSSTLIIDIPGEKADTLNIVVPVDHPRSSASGSDGAINLALGLALAREFYQRDIPIGLRILFLGAEFSGDKEKQLGAGNFLSDFFPEEPQAFLYLNLTDIPKEILIQAGGDGIVAPYWYVWRTIGSLEASGLPYHFKNNENQIHRLGMWHTQTRINPFLQAGYPGITLQGESAGETRNPIRWVTSFFTFFFSFLDKNSNGFPEEWDRHYLYFDLAGSPLSIGEGLYISFLLGIIILPLGYPFFRTRRFQRYLRTIRRNLWAIPVLLSLIFLFLLIGTYALKGLLVLRDFPTIWHYTPFPSFMIKTGVAMVLFFLFFGLLRQLPFSHSSSFYTSSALLFFMLAMIILGSLDISMTVPLLWAFGFSFLFSIVPSRLLKTGMLILSVIPVLSALHSVFTEQAITVIEYMILSPLWGNLFLSLLILPYLLMLIRLDFLFRHPTMSLQKRILINAGIIAVSISFISILYIFSYDPYSGPRPQPVTVTEKIFAEGYERKTSISSPAPVRSLLLFEEGGSQELIFNTRQAEFTDRYDTSMVTTSVSLERFLDRDRYLITLDTEVQPDSFEISFYGTEDFLIYDIEYPYTMSDDGKSARIHIGHNPPVPLVLDTIFLAGTVQQMRIRARFSGPFPDRTALGSDYLIHHIREYADDINLFELTPR
ncbi:hypothetical protein [Marispirochaeta sp.]|uniref:hypothetical protein n=1 Tax=Marispirochaeta sp. TaxID=2038653 RepID=UPI0029C75EED|nr:hypothetical protein [Marispirochaeta sp.]